MVIIIEIQFFFSKLFSILSKKFSDKNYLHNRFDSFLSANSEKSILYQTIHCAAAKEERRVL